MLTRTSTCGAGDPWCSTVTIKSAGSGFRRTTIRKNGFGTLRRRDASSQGAATV